jgi:cytochrome P450
VSDGECPVKDWITDYDVMDRDYARDPYRIWKEMRDSGCLVHSDRWGGSWMATRYSDLQELVRQVPALSSRSPTVVPLPPELRQQVIQEVKAYGSENPPITSDPPEHKPFKQLILPFFTPAAVEEYRKFTEELCHELIDRFIARGACDAAEDYAQQIPPRVIAQIIGIDPARGDEFTEWTRGTLELGQTDPEKRMKYRKIIRDFFGELVCERRKDRRDDLISQLIASEVDGQALNDHTIIGICNLLLVAGIDTTWSSIGSSLWHFAGNANDRRRMVAEPELFPTAIEELLRYYAPVMMARRVLEPVAIGSTEMQPGDRLILNFPAGNHDPEVFDRADEVVLDRQRNRHIAFGVGIHRCAGSNLARMEMDVALRAWFSRVPEFELTDPNAVTWAGGQVRGPRSVPVRFPTSPSPRMS